MCSFCCGVIRPLVDSPGPVIGGQVCRVPPISTKTWMEKKALFDKRTVRIWTKSRIELEGQAYEKICRVAILEVFR